MNIGKQRNHVIDFIFPISLFFVFAVSSLVVILLAANIYQSTTRESIDQDASRTILSYISEKIHQGDFEGGVSVDTLEDKPCLLLEEIINDTKYCTYIYEYQGHLKELYIKEGIDPSLESGKDILEISAFQAEEVTDSLFRFTITTKDGSQDSITTGIKSR